MDNTITISRREYFDLKCDELKLALLEAGGVDNWCNYSESLRDEDTGKTYLDMVDELEEEILGQQS